MAFYGSGTPNQTMKVSFTTGCGLMVGIFLGIFLGNSSRLSTSEIYDREMMISSSHGFPNGKDRPRGTDGLPLGIIVAETDLYLRRLWGNPQDDLPETPSTHLVTFTVGVKHKEAINLAVSKFPKEWTIMLFHYDGKTDDWDEFEWSQTAIHVSARKQTKWWFAKRFLHPDVVAAFDYIFLWDEDLGVEHFDGQKYIDIVRKHDLDISQPALDPPESFWEIVKKRPEGEMHHTSSEGPGMCSDPNFPPCADFVEIQAPVFSKKAWRCMWHMIQNDLVHGWGLDLNMRRCVAPPVQKMGVVDAQWIQHNRGYTLGEQGPIGEDGKPVSEGVIDRCFKEMGILGDRLAAADNASLYMNQPPSR